MYVCIHSRTGSKVQRNHNRRTVGPEVVQATYQRPGDKSCTSCNQVLPSSLPNETLPHQSPNGQLNCSRVYQQKRGDKVIHTSSHGCNGMNSLPTTSDVRYSTTPTRNPELWRRLGLASFQRPNRMDTWQVNLQSYTQTVFYSTSGPIRISAEPPAASLCVEISRPRSNGCGHADVRMAQLDVIHSCTNNTVK